MTGAPVRVALVASTTWCHLPSLPIAVMLLVYISSPTYIELLWTHPMGRFMRVCCLGWMTCGVLVMKKMINFDF